MAIILIAIGLWVPFYIGGELLPDAWLLQKKGEHCPWWSFPAFVSLGAFAVVFIICGVGACIEALED